MNDEINVPLSAVDVDIDALHDELLADVMGDIKRGMALGAEHSRLAQAHLRDYGLHADDEFWPGLSAQAYAVLGHPGQGGAAALAQSGYEVMRTRFQEAWGKANPLERANAEHEALASRIDQAKAQFGEDLAIVTEYTIAQPDGEELIAKYIVQATNHDSVEEAEGCPVCSVSLTMLRDWRKAALARAAEAEQQEQNPDAPANPDLT